MSDRRQVWATLASLLQRVESALPTADNSAITTELHKLAKSQFKLNTLLENQNAHWESITTTAQNTQTQNETLLQALQTTRTATASRHLLLALLPTLDNLEQALQSGQQYLSKRDQVAQNPNLSPRRQQQLVSPADRAILAGWLDGLRLTQEQLLAALASAQVTPIPTVGHAFNPHQHHAVKTIPAGNNPPNQIAAEERRGYQTPDEILRYAEVIVYK